MSRITTTSLPLLLLTLAALLLTAPALALESFQASYKLTWNRMHVGDAVYELQVSPRGDVLFKARVEPRGLAALIRNDIISEQSLLRLDEDDNLIALSYEYLHQRGRRTEEEKSITFDWNRQQARSLADGEEVHLDLKPGIVDRMSLQLKIMQDGSQDDAFDRLDFIVVEDLELRDYTFKVTGRERIRTDAGTYDTVRLQHDRNSRSMIFWAAPQLGYLPVRVEQLRDGRSTSRMDLTQVSGPLTQR